MIFKTELSEDPMNVNISCSNEITNDTPTKYNDDLILKDIKNQV